MTSHRLQARVNGENEPEEEGSTIDLRDAPWNKGASRLPDGRFRRLTAAEMELYTLEKMEQRGLLGHEHWLKDHRQDDLLATLRDLRRNTDLRKHDTRPGRLSRMLWKLDAMLVAEAGPNAFMRILDQRVGDVVWLRGELGRLRGEEKAAQGEFGGIAAANEGLQQPQLVVPAHEQLQAAVDDYEQQLGQPLYDPDQWRIADDDGMEFQFNVQGPLNESPEGLSFDEPFQNDFNAIQSIHPPQPWIPQPPAQQAGNPPQDALDLLEPVVQEGDVQEMEELDGPPAVLQEAAYDIDDFDFDQFIIDLPDDEQDDAVALQHAAPEQEEEGTPVQPDPSQPNLSHPQQQAHQLPLPLPQAAASAQQQLPQTPPSRPSRRNTGLNGRYWQDQGNSATSTEPNDSGSSYQTRSGRVVRQRPSLSSGHSSTKGSK